MTQPNNQQKMTSNIALLQNLLLLEACGTIGTARIKNSVPFQPLASLFLGQSVTQHKSN